MTWTHWMAEEEETLNNPIIHPPSPAGSLLCLMLFYLTWIISYMSSERNSTHPIEFQARLEKRWIEATSDTSEWNDERIGGWWETAKRISDETWLWRERRKEKGKPTQEVAFYKSREEKRLVTSGISNRESVCLSLCVCLSCVYRRRVKEEKRKISARMVSKSCQNSESFLLSAPLQWTKREAEERRRKGQPQKE
jgi:hypothetical protein